MLCVDTSSPANRNAKPMRFEAAWLTHENFGTVFSEAWSAHSLSLPDAISSVRETCIQWNRDVFGDIFKKKGTYKLGWQESKIPNTMQLLIFCKTWKLICLMNIIELSMLRNFSGVKNLIEIGLLLETEIQISIMPPQSFEGDTQPPSQSYLNLQPCLTDDDSLSLLAPISMDEVKAALFSMKGLKSPGPDGIQPIFYQKHWAVVSGESPDTIQKFRPICLLNVAYKVLSKVIVNRLRPHLQSLIGPFQNSFLAGRSTTDNIILTQEAIHSMRRMKGRTGAATFKIDLHKAFDSISWDFLLEVLVDFNIPAPLIRLIMFSISSLKLSVLWNGNELPYFQPQHGLRQGDPLSPYLFIMAMEKLSHMILSQVQTGSWKPFKVSRGGLALSHLFFANDLMLFCQASQTQIAMVMDCLSEFSGRSGLEINLAKSKLYISPNIQSNVANALSSLCGIPLTCNLGVYLGVPIIHGRSTTATYKYIVEKIQIKLASWKQSLLSFASRRILVQSVTSSIPTYSMQSVLLPKSTCDAIDSLNRKFLWGSDSNSAKLHLVSWGDVCRPRGQGGLGLRTSFENNKAFIAKLGWQLLSGQNKPWCQALSQKYLRTGSLMNCPSQSASSVTWRSILKCRDVLQLGVRWQVGSSSNIKFWHDTWVGHKKLLDFAIQPIPQELIDLPVASFISSDKNWDLSPIIELLPLNVLDSITVIPLSITDQFTDSPFWHGSTTGDFTVSSAFAMLQSQRMASTVSVQWRWIWNIRCTERVKFFIWLLRKGRVLTNSVRFDRHMASSLMCPRCEQAIETPIHLLRDCYYSRLVWEVSDYLPSNFFHLDFDS
ncbi:hypothetical protein SLEP1_g9158 [Rubroshorea leprosula]|uniref:Reverse transcriptase domain-containing protein n=1 Tax=Rubroshorea leprosula TaxID=152421 RepID=A0AAV5ICE9_9ROSI|nr:hypothetical protein SLEP1_g9158 [Rubroshorea leprosula]